ncbi:hypothetical protein ACLESO_15470 [Pyxidicoccus sp. 3LG]
MSGWLGWLMPHLVVAPILLPMLTAAVMLLMGEGRRPVKAALGAGSALLGSGWRWRCWGGWTRAGASCTCLATGPRPSASPWWRTAWRC